MSVFLKKGYKDTSIDELVKATGVARYGLYSTFGNKQEMFLKILQHYRQTMTHFWSAGLDREDAKVDEVKNLVNRLQDFAQGSQGDTGCLMCKTAASGKSIPNDIRAEVDDYFDYFHFLFFRAFENSRKAEELPKGFDSRANAEFYICVLKTSDLLARADNPDHLYNGYFTIAHDRLNF
jgi:TetR/AcrR family transcriptional repressor of nem operon